MKNPSAPIHISEEALELYSMRRLPDEELELTEEHLRVCHHCQRNLAETGDFVRRLKTAAARVEADYSGYPLPDEWSWHPGTEVPARLLPARTQSRNDQAWQK